jgi:hypothetical protein
MCVLGVSMLVMHLCLRGIDVGHAFVCKGYRCWSCICLLGYRCWSCTCVCWLSMLAIYLCDRGIDVGRVSVY